MERSPLGIAGQPAPELHIGTWRSASGPVAPVKIAEIAEPFIYLYFFQSWCPGCHSSGFPTMGAVREAVAASGTADRVRFVPVQTVFEGHETNTADAAIESLARHGLDDLVVGHDPAAQAGTMADYRTGGTPWTVLVGPQRSVLVDGFHHDADDILAAIAAFDSAEAP